MKKKIKRGRRREEGEREAGEGKEDEGEGGGKKGREGGQGEEGRGREKEHSTSYIPDFNLWKGYTSGSCGP